MATKLLLLQRAVGAPLWLDYLILDINKVRTIGVIDVEDWRVKSRWCIIWVLSQYLYWYSPFQTLGITAANFFIPYRKSEWLVGLNLHAGPPQVIFYSEKECKQEWLRWAWRHQGAHKSIHLVVPFKQLSGLCKWTGLAGTRYRNLHPRHRYRFLSTWQSPAKQKKGCHIWKNCSCIPTQ